MERDSDKVKSRGIRAERKSLLIHTMNKSRRLINLTFMLLQLLTLQLLLFPGLSLAASDDLHIININAQSNKQSFNGNIHYLSTREDSLSIDSLIMKEESSWRVHSSHTPTFAISDEIYWFKVSFRNIDEFTHRYILLCDYGALDEISLFWVKPETREVRNTVHTGDHTPFASRPIRHVTYAFPLTLATDEKIDVYLKIRSTGNMVVPLSIYEENTFFADQKVVYMIYAALMTIMFLTATYNFFIYFRTRENLFLSFSLFALFAAIVILFQSRLSDEFLWQGAMQYGERILIACVNATNMSHLWFSMLYLGLTNRFKRFFKFLISTCGVFLVLSLIVSYGLALKLTLSMSMLASISSLVAGYYWLMQGNKAAKVYAISWSIFIVGMFFSSSIRFGIVPFNWLTEYSAIIGAIITTITLSIALGDRITTEKVSRIEAQNDAIKHLERYQTLFEKTVEGIFFIDHHDKFIAANPAFLQMLSYSNLGVLQQHTSTGLSSIFENPTDLKILRKALKQAGSFTDMELVLKKHSGERFWVSMSAHAFTLADGKGFRIEGSVVNITNRKKTEQKLRYLATHDPLTGTFNRREFENQLKKAIEEPLLTEKYQAALYMDLDQFKVLNDTCGHKAGDILLRELTQLMINRLNNRGLLARLGGDEFGVLLQAHSLTESYNIAQELLTLVLNYRFHYRERIFSLGISIGMIEITENDTTVENIMSLADTACYVAKDEGGNRIHVYSANSVELQKRRTEMEQVISINAALEKGLFELHKQTIKSAKSDTTILGYELLIRMRDEEGTLVNPGAFIPAAERFNLMNKIDRWVIENAFLHLSNDKEAFSNGIHYAINLSGQTLADESFEEYLSEKFTKYAIPYESICFEITETAAIFNLTFLLSFMNKFQSLGCTFSLDDFGSGFSSYGYLKNLPVNYLKIDGSFVVKIAEDPVDYVMVKSINEVAKALGMHTIAEFVEDENIVKKLDEIGVDFLQGYFIDRPEKLHIPDTNPSLVQDIKNS